MNDSVTGMVGILLTVIVLTAFIQFGYWVWKRIRMHKERRRQLKFIANEIAQCRTRILDLGEDNPYPQKHGNASIHQIRYLHYEHMHIRLESALSDQTSRLTNEEVEALQNILFGAKYRMLKDTLFSKPFYVTTFEEVRALHWLNLPPMTQPRN